MVNECTDVNGVEKVSIRFLEQKGIVEMFLMCWTIESTKAGNIHRCMKTKFGFSLCAASFEGASNIGAVFFAEIVLMTCFIVFRDIINTFRDSDR